MATWSCTKLLKIYSKVANFITPIKSMAFTVLVLGLVDNLTSPLQHAIGGGNTSYSQTPLEIAIRVLFVFCGIYGIMGNGKTKRVRATIVSLPLLYLVAFYLLLWLKFGNDTFLALMALTGLPGLWMLLFGDNYDK